MDAARAASSHCAARRSIRRHRPQRPSTEAVHRNLAQRYPCRVAIQEVPPLTATAPLAALASELTERLRRTLPGAELQETVLPLVPELRLMLLHEQFDRGPLPHEVAAAVMADPAYWAFCWASGQALARWILDHPDEVAGRTVLDFGAGSGIAGIAAARAGARAVIACDLDPDARLACRVNALLNGVALEAAASLDAAAACDLVLVADVLYDPANRPLVDALLARFPDVLLADSRVRPEALTDWRSFHAVRADTLPDLDESPMFRQVRFYRPLHASRPGRADAHH